MTDLHSLAFQVRRKRFKIEAFRLPPEGEGDARPESKKAISKTRGVPAGVKRSGSSCGGGGGAGGGAGSNSSSLLDF